MVNFYMLLTEHGFLANEVLTYESVGVSETPTPLAEMLNYIAT